MIAVLPGVVIIKVCHASNPGRTVLWQRDVLLPLAERRIKRSLCTALEVSEVMESLWAPTCTGAHSCWRQVEVGSVQA